MLLCHYVALDGEGDYDADYTEIVALCGKRAVLDPDGQVIPEDFDFVGEPDPFDLCTCAPCLAKLTEAPAKTRTQERVTP